MMCSKCGNLNKGSFIQVNISSKPSTTLRTFHGYFEDLIEDVEFVGGRVEKKIHYKEPITGKIKVGWFENILECKNCKVLIADDKKISCKLF